MANLEYYAGLDEFGAAAPRLEKDIEERLSSGAVGVKKYSEEWRRYQERQREKDFMIAIRDKIEERVVELSGRVRLKYSKHKYETLFGHTDAVNSAVHELQNSVVAEHPRIKAEIEIYGLRDGYRRKQAKYEVKLNYNKKENEKTPLQRYHEQYDKASKIGQKTLVQILKSLMLQKLLDDSNGQNSKEIFSNEDLNDALEDSEKKDAELLTYHLLYLLDKKPESDKIKPMFSDFIRMKYTQQDVPQKEIFEASKDERKPVYESRDLLELIMLKKYVAKYGDFSQKLDIYSEIADILTHESWVQMDYIELGLTDDFIAGVDNVALNELIEHFKTKGFEPHFQKMHDLLIALESNSDAGIELQRHNKLIGDWHLKYGAKAEHFKKALAAYKKAEYITIPLERIEEYSCAVEDIISQQDLAKIDWKDLTNKWQLLADYLDKKNLCYMQELKQKLKAKHEEYAERVKDELFPCARKIEDYKSDLKNPKADSQDIEILRKNCLYFERVRKQVHIVNKKVESLTK
jgi:hypothetical protein